MGFLGTMYEDCEFLCYYLSATEYGIRIQPWSPRLGCPKLDLGEGARGPLGSAVAQTPPLLPVVVVFTGEHLVETFRTVDTVQRYGSSISLKIVLDALGDPVPRRVLLNVATCRWKIGESPLGHRASSQGQDGWL